MTKTTHLESPHFHTTRCGLPLAGLPALNKHKVVRRRPSCKSCARALAAAKKAGLR